MADKFDFFENKIQRNSDTFYLKLVYLDFLIHIYRVIELYTYLKGEMDN